MTQTILLLKILSLMSLRSWRMKPVQMDLLFDLPIVDPVEVVAEKPEAPVYFNLDDTTEEFNQQY